MQSSNTATRFFTNRLCMPIRWVDLDAYGHVNNAKFFDGMTEARAVLLQKLMPRVDICQFILVDTHCNFKRPYTYPSVMVIDQFIETIGGSSFTFYYKFSEQNDLKIVYAEGTAKMVCFDPKLGRAIKMPEEVKALLASF
jgi:acyl-CoA thioester hydrolase